MHGPARIHNLLASAVSLNSPTRSTVYIKEKAFVRRCDSTLVLKTSGRLIDHHCCFCYCTSKKLQSSKKNMALQTPPTHPPSIGYRLWIVNLVLGIPALAVVILRLIVKHSVTKKKGMEDGKYPHPRPQHDNTYRLLTLVISVHCSGNSQ